MRRRDWIRTAAVAPLIVPSRVLGRGGTAPSDRVVMGCVGVGGMGSGHVRRFLQYDEAQIVAVCDVHEGRRQRAKGYVDTQYGNDACDTYGDFRELLDRGDIDAITNATPDHWHVLVGIEAARRGKHMYYEKPLARTVEEMQAMRAAVRRYGVIFQFGTQQRSAFEFRHASDLARTGRLGELKTMMVSSAPTQYRPNQPEQPVPKGFDYDMWLGPAPWSPYSEERCTRNWTLIYDYSLGCVSGAYGIHDVDIAQWANDSDDSAPLTVEGWGTFPDDGLYDTALAWETEHTYANGVKLIYMDARTAAKRAKQFERGWWGILLVGAEGWVLASRKGFDAHPRSLLSAAIGPNEERLPRIADHRRNLLDAIRFGVKPVTTIEGAVNSDITCHQADIAMRLKRKLTWDPRRERFVNDDEANRMLSRSMRSPWRL